MFKTVKSIIPFVLLGLALTFMTQFKQWETLSAKEEVEITNFQKEASKDQSQSKTAENNQEDGAKASASSANETEQTSTTADHQKEYAITSNQNIVRVYDQKGEQVFKTTLSDWKKKQSHYYDKYNLDS
ncbi:hypothetical protein CEH05_15990 [Halobacillus halophilus]|uniref:PGA biosynthesis protein CapE n=1 Tax=Halobacillus halophilus (strain ATCC 35676 / DSM 2266 / JCM 20832 / KCTC 3685 / LMG 17431 / NBRC 102448 / NCIMB 2269) TaxID=866895 RepID=I0JR01_HALH3|nr:hypothetical protein [Halobacillus halophilus]ASF40571.1 hypothetical protein CEH05_15990 [Halobacillus halophilus]CCG46571.1 PGA biosynthesis protein CapE [Halobacillus halophilus DSM 2266]